VPLRKFWTLKHFRVWIFRLGLFDCIVFPSLNAKDSVNWTICWHLDCSSKKIMEYKFTFSAQVIWLNTLQCKTRVLPCTWHLLNINKSFLKVRSMDPSLPTPCWMVYLFEVSVSCFGCGVHAYFQRDPVQPMQPHRPTQVLPPRAAPGRQSYVTLISRRNLK
jgi:hypothetical protein